MTTKGSSSPKDRRPAESSKAASGKRPSLGSRQREALHKGSDPAYPADEARASDPGREKPQE